MASEYSHIFLRGMQETKQFTPPRRPIRKNIPQRNREMHSVKLQKQWEEVWAKAKATEESRIAVSMPIKDGVYIEFKGAVAYDLVTRSLEDRRVGDPTTQHPHR